MSEDTPSELIALTADIASAYVSQNTVAPADIPTLIQSIHKALATVGATEPVADAARKTPAVSIKKSLGHDYLICLEDGGKFRSLKRHLRTKYNMSPDDYRAKWGLPRDYPMVAPAYAAARSALAKATGLGQGVRAASTAQPAEAKRAGTKAAGRAKRASAMAG